jgi:hypothetical protein
MGITGKYNRMTTISLKIPAALGERMTAAAAKRGTAKSALVRRAIEAYLGSKGQAQAGSCLDLAGDLIGSIEGPRDLSSNKKHLGRFGA